MTRRRSPISGTGLPATTPGAFYGTDVAAMSAGPGELTEVLVAGYEGGDAVHRMITASSVGLPQRENTQLGGSGLLG
ncbi:hypothetical protein [Streptomyces luteogriseus]|uniref:hypothetical protein n=1 Tax=Streptomyces luteogriseus TaxID=68233 RepID=UPI003811EA5D